MSDAEQLWKATAQLLRAQVSDAVWLSTFQDITVVGGDESTLYLRSPNTLTRDRIMSRYMPLLRDALDEVNRGDLDIVVEVANPADLDNDLRSDHDDDSAPWSTGLKTGSSTGAGAPSNSAQPEPVPGNPNDDTAPIDLGGLNPRYTFETFVRGQSNGFAMAAAQRVAETPGRSFNPLFIYGSAGLGKTHLLHAIGHYVRNHYQHDVVRYVSTETLMNEFVESLRRSGDDRMAMFKRRYREVDVLLVDDIQFMEGKESLQEEFFHTFNALHGQNKQVVISSDRLPDAIPTLEDRLRSRFKWGLITDVQPPDLETRLAILRNKAERDRSPVPADVLEFIASHVTSNIRALEGALIRITAFASLNRVPITIHLAQQLLADLLTDTVKPRTDEELLNDMAMHLGFSVEALRGKSRQRPLVTARQIAMYLFRELTDLSYPAIARLFGGRDHTTVIHAVEKIQRLMRERKPIYDQITDLSTKLKRA